MAQPALETKWVKVANADLHLNAYLATPSGEGPLPAVIVFQEIFGVNSHIRDVTERIAREGYVAIAPNIYQRQIPELELGYSPADIQRGREYKDQTRAEELISDTQATIAFLRTLPRVQGDQIGCIGFCFGGHVAYLAATLADIQVTASFYGAGITMFTPGGGPPTVTRTPEIQGTIYLFFGEADASIPSQQVEQIEAALNQNQVSHQIWRYAGAEHGFFCDRRDSYDRDAAHHAWEQVKQLFQTTLESKTAAENPG